MKCCVGLLAVTVGCTLGLGAAALRADDASPALGKKVENFTLKDYRGKSWSLDDFKDQKLVVVAFLGTECPLVKLYGPRLAKLSEEYRGKSVAFLGVNSNTQDSVTEIAAFARRHGIAFPILKDVGNVLADKLGAKRTPEVFVLDGERAVRYHGRIDDQYGVGYARDSARQQDLKAALDELLAGKAVSRPTTPVQGCIIGRVQTAKAEAKVTYSRHISRILQNRCVECHRAGDIAPFALTEYKEVAGWADMIAEVVTAGRMPPWHASPKHGKFLNDRRLTEEEKKQILQWVKDGAPEGDPKDLPEPKKYLTGWNLPREPDVVFTMQPRPFRVPASGAVKYQYFTVPTNFKEEKWMQAAQIIPGNRAVVHHVLCWAVPISDAQRAMRDIGEGGAGFLVGYVPGQRSYVYPEGMAKRIPAKSVLIFQVHYTPVGTEQTDQSKIGIIFADPKKVKYEVKTQNAVQRFLNIPPGADNHPVEAVTRRPIPDSLLLGFMPHMHLRGKSFRYEVVYPNGKKETVLDVPNYDFNWQTNYRLAEPLKLPAGTKIHCYATFDNSENNLNNPNPKATVRWGSQTWQEMMIGFFDIAVPRTHGE